jgi:predicted O-methyltransferase YrrM
LPIQTDKAKDFCLSMSRIVATHRSVEANSHVEIQTPFNGNLEFGTELLEKYLKPFEIQACIETGTYKGGSTVWFAQHLPEVHTIEINISLTHENMARFAQFPNIQAHHGNSPSVLRQLLSNWSGSKRTLFYLDAHWNDYWPLNDELIEISKSALKSNCIVVIDDFKVPDRPDVPFDRYKDQPLDYNFVKTALQQAIPNAVIFYYAPPPELARTRGRLIAIPPDFK